MRVPVVSDFVYLLLARGAPMRSLKIFAAVPHLYMGAVIVGFLLTSIPMSAHHGRATYDETKLATIMGTVSSFQFSNPHALLVVDVRNDKGNVVMWFGEGTSPNMLVRE